MTQPQPSREAITEIQRKNRSRLQENFKLSDADIQRCLFFDQDEPWIPPDILNAIARQHGGFSGISVTHDKYVPAREQVIYEATVLDAAGRPHTRSGAALLGERPKNGIAIDAEKLAEGRALGAALRAAGFDPFQAGSIVELGSLTLGRAEAGTQNAPRFSPPLSPEALRDQLEADEAALRNKDLRQIHALAEQKGLIQGKDMTLYRQVLKENFGTVTAAVLNHAERVAVINFLSNYGYQEFLDSVPVELQADALIA